MQNSARDLMLAQAAFIVASEEHADRLAPAITALRDRGEAASADALMKLARMHRVRALQARGQLVALAGEGYSTTEADR